MGSVTGCIRHLQFLQLKVPIKTEFIKHPFQEVFYYSCTSKAYAYNHVVTGVVFTLKRMSRLYLQWMPNSTQFSNLIHMNNFFSAVNADPNNKQRSGSAACVRVWLYVFIYLFIYCHLYSALSIVQCSNALYRL